jgi:excisionase family DNA binding protein
MTELQHMPPTLTPAEAMPWIRLSRSVFYKLLASGEIGSCRLGHSIRIPTRRFLEHIGVLATESDD